MDAAPRQTAAPSTRGRRERGVSGDDRERAILATAERLLAAHPLADISVDQLAKGAGLSRSAFYFYFTSKEQVLLALFDRVVDEARFVRGDALLRLADDEEQGWRDAISPIVTTFAEHRAIASAAWAAQYSSAAVRELWGQVLEQFVAEVTAAIEAERRRGAAPQGPPARDLAVVLNCMVERALFSTFSDHATAVPEERLLDTLVSVFLGTVYRRPFPEGG